MACCPSLKTTFSSPKSCCITASCLANSFRRRITPLSSTETAIKKCHRCLKSSLPFTSCLCLRPSESRTQTYKWQAGNGPLYKRHATVCLNYSATVTSVAPAFKFGCRSMMLHAFLPRRSTQNSEANQATIFGIEMPCGAMVISPSAQWVPSSETAKSALHTFGNLCSFFLHVHLKYGNHMEIIWKSNPYHLPSIISSTCCPFPWNDSKVGEMPVILHFCTNYHK